MAGFFKNLFSKRSQKISTGSLDQWNDFWYSVGGSVSGSGAVVSRESAMRQWAVYACISEISQTLAQLPLKLKRPRQGGGTEDATDHPLFDLCKNAPNKMMTSFSWRESQQANLLASGNCFNYIDRSRLGVRQILPIAPTAIKAKRATGREMSALRLDSDDRIVYEVETVDGARVVPSSDILHVVGFGFDGLMGESVIKNYARETIGTAIALDEFQSKSLSNGMFPSGVLEHPDVLGDSKEAFIEALETRYAGTSNARRPMVLENGMKFNKIDMSLVDRQFVDQLKMTATQICGIFKVPPHRVGIFEKNTNYNNTEQGNKSFLDGCMQQWVVRWEQAMAWKLLTRDEKRAGYFFKFNFDALLRPDGKTRSEIAFKEWQTGVPLNVIRERNDENPIEGGDESFVPANMIPARLAGQQQINKATQGAIEGDDEGNKVPES